MKSHIHTIKINKQKQQIWQLSKRQGLYDSLFLILRFTKCYYEDKFYTDEFDGGLDERYDECNEDIYITLLHNCRRHTSLLDCQIYKDFRQ